MPAFKILDRSSPDIWPFAGKGTHKKINEGAHFGLGKATRRIDQVNALFFLWQMGHHINNLTRFHCLRIEKAWQICDPEARNRRMQKRLPVVHAQRAASSNLAQFTRV